MVLLAWLVENIFSVLLTFRRISSNRYRRLCSGNCRNPAPPRSGTEAQAERMKGNGTKLTSFILSSLGKPIMAYDASNSSVQTHLSIQIIFAFKRYFFIRNRFVFLSAWSSLGKTRKSQIQKNLLTHCF